MEVVVGTRHPHLSVGLALAITKEPGSDQSRRTSCCGTPGPPPLRVSLALAIVDSMVAVEISIDVAVCSKAVTSITYPMVWLSISLCLGSRRCSSKGHKEKN